MDVFISYRRDTGIVYARLLKMALENFDVNVFMDIESLTSEIFSDRIEEYIKNCDFFLLLCTPNALDRCGNEGDWITKEIGYAVQYEKTIIPIGFDGFREPETLPQIVQYAMSFNGVKYSDVYFDATIQKILGFMKKEQVNNPRKATKYVKSESEVMRLKSQQELLRNFDKDVIGRIISSYEELYILDAGSGDGEMVMSRFGDTGKVKKIIGIDFDKDTVEEANSQFAANGKAAFYNVNLESPDFSRSMQSIMEAESVESFNVVILSMIYLLLERPAKMLRNIRKIMADGGVIFIRDIDDGFNVVYEDPDRRFERAIDLCNRDRHSGYRYSGRQIFQQLVNSGFKNVKLEKIGLDTTNMSADERQTFFDMYFRFLPSDLKLMTEEEPNNTSVKRDYEWITSVIDDMEEAFLKKDFFFLLGFVIYTAIK